jgi:hypothetical protein
LALERDLKGLTCDCETMLILNNHDVEKGLQFASVGGMVYRLAREREVGRELVQDIRD